MQFHYAGRFVSRGKGRHSTRVIDSFELIFVDSGSLDLFEGDQAFHLTAGDWLLLRPNLRHGGLSAYEPGLVFYWCHFMPRDAEGRRRLGEMASSGHADRPGRFGEYCSLLLSELREKGAGRTADLLVELLLQEAEGNSTGAQNIASPGLPEQAREYIKLHFEESLSTALLAEALHCSADYLNRICRRSWGHTVTEEINLQRLAYACRLLRAGKRNIKEVAYDSGFNDPAYFRRRFRAVYGQTPGEYRAGHSFGHVNTE